MLQQQQLSNVATTTHNEWNYNQRPTDRQSDRRNVGADNGGIGNVTKVKAQSI